MATTTASLFRRSKPLNAILGAFTKAAAELDQFIKSTNGDVAGINKEIGKLTGERSIAEADIARAVRAKAKIVDFVA